MEEPMESDNCRPIKNKVEPISEDEANKLQDEISKSKTSLMLDYPFWGYIAMNLPFRLTTEEEMAVIPTAGVSYKEVIFNPHFYKALNKYEKLFLMGHELMHPMLEHLDRRGERDPKIWNIAGDIVINHHLTSEGIGTMPECGVRDEELYKEGKGITERIYTIIMSDKEKYKGYHEGDGAPFDIQIEDGKGESEAEIEQRKQEWKQIIASAKQTAKMAGNMSANMELLVNDMLEPKVNWTEVMNRFQVKARIDQRSFNRFNRRFLSQGLYLPHTTGDVLGEVAYCLDMSGSCMEHTTQFISEANAVREDLNPKRIHMIYFDSDVCGYDVFEQGEEIKFNPRGGGGTAFSPCFKFMQEKDIDPVACVFLTDLECDDFGEAPDYPVLWVSTEKGDAPFGEIVLM